MNHVNPVNPVNQVNQPGATGPRRAPRAPRATRRLVHTIAEAVAEQGPAAREQYAAAVDVLRALNRAGYEIVRRTKLRPF